MGAAPRVQPIPGWAPFGATHTPGGATHPQTCIAKGGACNIGTCGRPETRSNKGAVVQRARGGDAAALELDHSERMEFVKNEGHPFELAVINPALVVGASISGDIGESNKAVAMVAGGKIPVAVPLMFGYVDVRDVAAAHILAMQNPASNGERFALVEKDLWYKDVAKILRDNGFNKAPAFGVPVWLAKILANFNKELKLTLPYLGRKRSIKNTKAKEILGWDPRPAEESILDIANQMKDLGMLK